MSFNADQFNQTSFNAQGITQVFFDADIVEMITAIFGGGIETYLAANGIENINAKVSGIHVISLLIDMEEAIDANIADPEYLIMLTVDGIENVTETAVSSANIFLSVSGIEEINSTVSSGVKIYLKPVSTEIIDASIFGNPIYYITAEGYELVSESASLVFVNTKTCVLKVTLTPGQTLIVDANSYNVLLDGENAIDTHSGEWIDELDRDTTILSILADAGVANLEADIVYTERYL